MYYGERFNAISHMVGAVASIGALVTMVVIAAGTSDPYRVVGASVFGATLVLLYVISTLYHSVRKPRLKAILQKCDHAAIYLLIYLTIFYTGPGKFSQDAWWLRRDCKIEVE